MTRPLDLADIQGNIVLAYGRYGFPKARYFFLNIRNEAAGRRFVDQVRRKVTSAERWSPAGQPATAFTIPKPKVTVNIGFSFLGLLALGLPTRTLAGLPPEFIDGMAARNEILGDIGDSAPERWDPLWLDRDRPGRATHIWVALNGGMTEKGDPSPELEAATDWLRSLAEASAGGVALLTGYRGKPDQPDDFQDCSAILARLPNGQLMPTAKEHLGYTDGLGDPVFSGQFVTGRRPHDIEVEEEAQEVIGRGKLTADQRWVPLAAGEFILGHADESQEIPPSAQPIALMRNGTFMAYRKLHENVGSFQNFIAEQAALYQAVTGCADPAEASETIRAKMAGRWSDGVPLMKAPDYQAWRAFHEDWKDVLANMTKRDKELSPEEQGRRRAFERELIDFTYGGDQAGATCPVSAHIRRANPRDMLDPNLDLKGKGDSAVINRRRILRRGLPYGDSSGPMARDDAEHGIIFLATCANLFRQFEFVQQQWMQYGLDFNVGNATCPIIGNHLIPPELGRPTDRFVIAADPAGDKPPFLCTAMPNFVTTRGGDYFFLPSLTALSMIAMGTVDPT